MITPAFAPTATERVLPKVTFDFTAATLDSRITFTRALNTATRVNSSGKIETVNADTARFDYDPVTLACKGLLIEESRTNLLLNSLIDGTSLATQSVTVTAAAHTLSFYGTGSVALSGTHTASVAGTGAYPTRKTYTFTPTAGSLTLTVTGTVQFAQLELGAFATSFIPTDATVKTRNADVATMTGTNFSSWYNANEGTFFVNFINPLTSGNRFVFEVSDVSNNNRMSTYYNGVPTLLYCQVRSGGATQASMYGSGTPAPTVGTQSVCYGYKANNFAASRSGSDLISAGSGSVPTTVSQLEIGRYYDGAQPLNGHVCKLMYWPFKLVNAEVQAFAKS